jgi:hypothetical protein
MFAAYRSGISQGREWAGGVLAVGAAVGLWIAVIGGVAAPLADWMGRGGMLHPTPAAVQVRTASAPDGPLTTVPGRR